MAHRCRDTDDRAGGLCVTGEVALARAARIGAQELAGLRQPWPVAGRTAAAEGPRYQSTLLLLRIIAQTAAIVLLTAAFVTGWARAGAPS